MKLEYFSKSVASVWPAPTCLVDFDKKKKKSSEREILWGSIALYMEGDHGWIERLDAPMNELFWVLQAKP